MTGNSANLQEIVKKQLALRTLSKGLRVEEGNYLHFGEELRVEESKYQIVDTEFRPEPYKYQLKIAFQE